MNQTEILTKILIAVNAIPKLKSRIENLETKVVELQELSENKKGGDGELTDLLKKVLREEALTKKDDNMSLEEDAASKVILHYQVDPPRRRGG